MQNTILSRLYGLLLAVLTVALLAPAAALAADRTALERDARNAYNKLVARVPAAKALSREADAVLVFPKITKAGLVVGGQYGDGVLFRGDKIVGYYNTSGASYGFQAGAQQFGYAMFLMTDAAIESLSSASGMEIGVGPTVVVVDRGSAANLTTTTTRSDIYAFAFSQRGLMAGLGLQGNRIAKVPRR